ncbi:AMP-binding protein [Nonomuraea sp. B12E4]|uniref:AMP-binding protein n=1 Tax=Nonomuraea sp. B12E4 TaxID=3153564 RepID=UPI00325E6BFF
MHEPLGLTAGFRWHATHRPDAPAMVWHGRETSYGELSAMAGRAMAGLEELELGEGEPVGLLAAKSPAAVALVLACLLGRRPFLLPSPALAGETLTELFAAAGCAHVLSPDAESGFTRAADAAMSPGPVSPGTATPGTVAPGTVPADVCFMLTTSGSTGLPKIVPLPRDAVDRFVAWAGPAFGIGPGRNVLNYAPLNFDLCLLDVWTTLAHGGCVVLVDPERAADGRRLADLLAAHPVHVFQAVPMCFGLLPENAVFGEVEHVMFTGDAIPERTLERLPGLFPKARLYNIYGCTETNDSFVHELDGIGSPVPLGEPLPGVSVLVVDQDGGLVDGPGAGELYVSTPFQTRGYLGRAGRFGPHPRGLDDRVYFRSGDLVRRDPDGRIFLVGRADFQVKVRGVAVNTAEIEQALLEHPSVLEAAVVAEPDAVAGRRLVCVVRRAPASGLNSLRLREHCARRLPKAAIPAVTRIIDEPLPKTSTGKVDRNAAGRLYQSFERLPGDGTTRLPGDGTTPLPGDGADHLPGDGTEGRAS